VDPDQEFTLLDWSTAELPGSILIREIPKPGILFAIGRLPVQDHLRRGRGGSFDACLGHRLDI
jgi:hypothetical protein